MFQAVSYTPKQLAGALGLTLYRDGKHALTDPAPLETAQAHQFVFVAQEKYLKALEKTNAGLAIVTDAHKDTAPQSCAVLLSSAPFVDYIRAVQLFIAQPKAEIHQTATIHPTAQLGKNISLAPGVVVGEGCIIGDNCRIGAHVTLQHTTLGKHVIIHPQCSIGQDGFGYVREGNTIHKIPQVGRVMIEDNVEIGAGTTIDRGALANTHIGAGTKIDNQVQVAHNVVIGRNCQISGQVGFAGSCTIGDNVIIGGQTGITGHISIADGVHIAGRSGVIKSITVAGSTYAGFPAVPITQWRQQEVKLRRLLKK